MSRPAPGVVRGTGPLTGLELHVAPVGGSRLVDDYHIGHPALAPFFGGHAYDEAAYRRKAAEVDARLGAAARESAAPALQPTSARAAERLHRVLAGDGYVVTTGQQAGLFGGPLYTVYKALSAVQLAATLERRLGKPVVPVFWVAADDHDFDEVDHIVAVDEQDGLQTIALFHDADAPALSMAEQPLPAAVTSAIDTLAATLPGGPFADEAIARLRAHYRPGRSMAGAFEALMSELLAPFDAVVVSSAHPALKRAAAPLLARELDAQGAHATLLARTTAALTAAGYAAQVPIAENASNVFHHGPGGRDRLVVADGAWQHRRSRERMTGAALHTLLRDEPERFSPNVLLRPVVESALLPTLAYVAGPAELAYFAQIGCLFRAHDIAPPVVFPRHGITFVDARIRRILDRHGLDVAAFERPASELVAHQVRTRAPEALTAALARLRASIEEGYAELSAIAAAIDPSLDAPLDGSRRRTHATADAVERRIMERLRARDDVTRRQIGRAAAWLRPGGAAQQRRLGIFSYLGRYGPAVVPAIAAAMSVSLDTPAPEWSGVRC